MAVNADDGARQRPPPADEGDAVPRNGAAGRTLHGELAESGIADVIGYRLAMASLTVRQLFARHVGKPLDLRPVEFTLLALIDANRDVTAKRLSQALAISAPRLTPILERLERHKLIRRVRSEADRRAQHIGLTELGERTTRKAVDQLHRAEAAHFAALSAGERAILVELLAKVALMAPR